MMQVDGQEMMCLRDPQGFAGQPLFLNGPQTFLVSLMDGTNTLRDIQASFFRQTADSCPLRFWKTWSSSSTTTTF